MKRLKLIIKGNEGFVVKLLVILDVLVVDWWVNLLVGCCFVYMIELCNFLQCFFGLGGWVDVLCNVNLMIL